MMLYEFRIEYTVTNWNGRPQRRVVDLSVSSESEDEAYKKVTDKFKRFVGPRKENQYRDVFLRVERMLPFSGGDTAKVIS